MFCILPLPAAPGDLFPLAAGAGLLSCLCLGWLRGKREQGVVPEGA